jgi:hypothetical protein|tara:strand:+ start:131 stop:748 length:618 start_codon:yes stop_codon:yes gene_type:complete
MLFPASINPHIFPDIVGHLSMYFTVFGAIQKAPIKTTKEIPDNKTRDGIHIIMAPNRPKIRTVMISRYFSTNILPEHSQIDIFLRKKKAFRKLPVLDIVNGLIAKEAMTNKTQWAIGNLCLMHERTIDQRFATRKGYPRLIEPAINHPQIGTSLSTPLNASLGTILNNKKKANIVAAIAANILKFKNRDLSSENRFISFVNSLLL